MTRIRMIVKEESVKAVCIIGSPHKNGSTALLVSRVVDGMKASGIAVKERILSELDIHDCKGCRSCDTLRRCIQRDDMDRVIQDILTADIVLLASPCYWGDVTGRMKMFMDRCLPLCNARTGESPVPKGKIGIGVAVRAGQSKAENGHLLETFRHYLGHLGIEMVTQLTAESVDKPSDLKAKVEKLEEAYQLGKTILQYLKAA